MTLEEKIEIMEKIEELVAGITCIQSKAEIVTALIMDISDHPVEGLGLLEAAKIELIDSCRALPEDLEKVSGDLQ